MSSSGSEQDVATSGGVVDRDRIVEAAITLYRGVAFHEVTLPEVARQANVDPAVVATLFPTVNDLVVTVVEVWNERRMAPLVQVGREHGAVAFLRGIVAANLLDPGLMRLLAALVNVAATPSHALADRLHDDWVHFHASVQRLLALDIEAGREPATMDPARGAEQLIALYEGLQLQAMVRRHMDLLAAFDRAVTRLRAGWSTEYTPPSWETQPTIVWHV